MDKAEVEKAVANAPQAPELARKHEDEQRKLADQRLDRAERRFCIEQATKACAAGGYDVQDIVRLTGWFYELLTGAPLPQAVANETILGKPLTNKDNRSVK